MQEDFGGKYDGLAAATREITKDLSTRILELLLRIWNSWYPEVSVIRIETMNINLDFLFFFFFFSGKTRDWV